MQKYLNFAGYPTYLKYMATSRTWPVELQYLGGISLLASHAAESQRRKLPGEFIQVVGQRRSRVKVRFFRAGYQELLGLVASVLKFLLPFLQGPDQGRQGCLDLPDLIHGKLVGVE